MRSAFGSLGFKLSQVNPSSLYNHHVLWWALRDELLIRLCAVEEALIAGEPPRLAGLVFPGPSLRMAERKAALRD